MSNSTASVPFFGLDGSLSSAAKRALQAAGAIEEVISDLNNRFGRQYRSVVKAAVSIHAGRVAVGEIALSDPPSVMAVGQAMDVTNEMRKLTVTHEKAFAISERVFEAADVHHALQDKVEIRLHESDPSVTVFLAERSPVPSQRGISHGEQTRGLIPRRLWSGS